MVTDKTKEKFEEWYDENHYSISDKYTDFDYFTFSMQWGVYLEFFDSVGYCISEYTFSEDKSFSCDVEDFKTKEFIDCGTFETRKEAQTEAIKKANELFNQSNR